MQEGSRKAVLAACAANAGIGIAKLVGFFLTGAASMLAEAVHSAADTSNQALLLFGASRAGRAASEEHPFGYSRERYFWAFIVALVLFMLGSLFAIYEGVSKLIHPHAVESPWIAVSILGVSLALESASFITAVKEARRVRGGQSWWQFIRKSKHAELPVVLLEDLGALVGLVLALAGVGLTLLTNDPRFDGLGSITIGVLLGAIAIVLALEMQSLLIGESASREQIRQIEETLLAAEHVERIVHMRTMHLGPDTLLVAAKLEFNSELDFQGVACAIDQAENGLRSAVPTARIVYIEPAVYNPDLVGA